MRRTVVVAVLVAVALFVAWRCQAGVAPTVPQAQDRAPHADAQEPAQGEDTDAPAGTLRPAPRHAPERVAVIAAPEFGAEPHEFALVLAGSRNSSRTVFLGLAGASLGWCWADGASTTIRFRGRTPELPIVLDFGLLRRIRLAADSPLHTSIGWDQRTGGAVELPAEELPGGFFPFPQGREAPPELAIAYGGGGGARWSNKGTRGAIDAVVVDAAGHPVEHAGLSLEPKRFGQTETAEGHTILRYVPNGTYMVIAKHERHGRATATVTVADDLVATTLQLSMAGCVRGHVVDPAGKPVASCRIVWVGDDGSWDNWQTTDDCGAFVFLDLTSLAGTLWVCAAKKQAVLPATGMRVDPTPGFDHVLTFDPAACTGGFAIEPVLPDTIPEDHIAVRLWQQQSGLGIHLTPGDDGTFATADLPAGQYACEVVAPGFGAVPAGTTWVDGRHTVHFGRFMPPPPATLVLDVAPDDLPDAEHRWFDLLHLRAEANLHVAPTEPLPAPTLLPGGDYALAWRDRDGCTRWERFTAKAGETVTVALRRDR